MKRIVNLLLISSALVFGGCSFGPLRGGFGIFRSPSFEGGVKQPQNPKDESSQEFERIVAKPDGSTLTEKVRTKVGAAQKDTGREIAAKLSSFKGIMWVGVLIFLFGAASLFYPPLKLIVGSVTTSVAACGAGLALMVLPSLLVGHEILILSIAVGAVGIYWFSHRHGSLRATVEHLKE